MKFNGLNLPSDISEALREYELEEDKSSFKLVCDFLEEFLYETGYLCTTVKLDKKETVTEETRTVAQKRGFQEKKQHMGIRLYYFDDEGNCLDFSSHDPNLIPQIKQKLLDSDKELQELCRNTLEKSARAYKSRLYSILGISHPKMNVYFDKKNDTYYVRKDVTVDGKQKQYLFGRYELKEVAENVRDFMESVNWDIKYSTKCTGLSGKKHRNFILSEMEKEKKLEEGEK